MIGGVTVDTASIEPATVAINTLTISGKHVTLDVFRQLQHAVLINHDGSLAGPPWGMVNYHQKSCDKLEKHVHVVWQLGDQLRQDTVQPPRWEPYWSDVCDAWVFAAGTVEPHRVTWGDDPVPPPPQNPVRPRQFRWWWPKSGRKSHRKQDTVRPPEPVAPSLPHPERPTRYIWSWPEFGDKSYRDGRHALIFPIDGIECSGHLPPDTRGGPELAAEHSAADYAALLAQLKEEVVAEKERRARHKARWAEILDLPQLFIAV
jgi:hypothetical protein